MKTTRYLLGVLLAAATTAHGQIVVTSFADTGPGTLREAITIAEADAEPNEIVFVASGQVTLASTLPVITGDLVIDADDASVVISGGSAVRAFIVNSGTVTFRGFDIVDADAPSGSGGGIDHNGGTLTVDGMTFARSSGVVGGGIVSTGPNTRLNVVRCVFEDNEALQSGAVHISGSTADIRDSTFRNNTALFMGPSAAGLAGATAVFGSTALVTIDNCLYTDNTSQRSAGTLSASDGTVRVTDTRFLDSASLDDGGAMSFVSGADLTFTRCLFDGNSCGTGGAVMSVQDRGTTVRILDSTATNNFTTGNGGGAFGVPAGTLIVDRSLIANNTSALDGGAISATRSGASVTVTNSTISHNTADRAGGAIAFAGSTIGRLENVTFAFNTSSIGGALSISSDVSEPIEIASSVFSGNTSSNDPNRDSISGSELTSLGFNLYEDAAPAVVDPSDLVNAVADLVPLADNGGPTFTHALGDLSDAIDAGSTTQAFDQRRLPRPFGVESDIGAFERTVLPDVDLAPPLGITDFFDALAYLRQFDAGDAAVADLSQDGEVNATDLVLYLRVFEGI